MDVLFWNTVVSQECSSRYSNLEHSGQTGVQWWMFQSGTQRSIRSAVFNVLYRNTAVDQECSGGCSNLEHSCQTNRRAEVEILIFNTVVKQESSC